MTLRDRLFRTAVCGALRAACLGVWLGASMAHSAPEPSANLDTKTFRVEQAFNDDDGNLIARVWSDADEYPNYQMLWAPKQTGVMYVIAPLRPTGGDDDYAMAFAAPTAANADRVGRIEVELGLRLTLSEQGRSISFARWPEQQERSLEDMLRASLFPVKALPNVRKVERFFRLGQRPEYLLVTAPKFSLDPTFELSQGVANAMRPLKVRDVQRSNPYTDARIELDDGRILVIPPPQGRGPSRLLLAPPDRTRIELVEEDSSPARLAAMGVDLQQFKTPPLQSPLSGPHRCRGVFGDER